MRRILIATHGKMASGLKNTLEMFIGTDNTLTSVDAYVEGGDEYLGTIHTFIKGHEDGDESIIFTDIKGGSVNQQVTGLVHEAKKDIFLISNVNLPLIISVHLHYEAITSEAIHLLIEECKPELIILQDSTNEESEEDFFG